MAHSGGTGAIETDQRRAALIASIAEADLADGRIDEGLARYREALELLGSAIENIFGDPFVVLLGAAAVCAHAVHGRHELVTGRVLADEGVECSQARSQRLRGPATRRFVGVGDRVVRSCHGQHRTRSRTDGFVVENAGETRLRLAPSRAPLRLRGWSGRSRQVDCGNREGIGLLTQSGPRSSVGCASRTGAGLGLDDGAGLMSCACTSARSKVP